MLVWSIASKLGVLVETRAHGYSLDMEKALSAVALPLARRGGKMRFTLDEDVSPSALGWNGLKCGMSSKKLQKNFKNWNPLFGGGSFLGAPAFTLKILGKPPLKRIVSADEVGITPHINEVSE